MEHRYKHILSPLKVGNVIFKNRLGTGRCNAQMLQGPEQYPAESTAQYLSDLAKNGAAFVMLAMGDYPEYKGRTTFPCEYDITNTRVQHYLRRVTERIHAHGSLVCASLMSAIPNDRKMSEIIDDTYFNPGGGPGGMVFRNPAFTIEELEALVAQFVKNAVLVKNLGADMVSIYMGYNASVLAHSLSPVYNQRTDRYGGSIEGRAQLTKEIFEGIKKACGKDFLIQIKVSGEEGIPGGYTQDDFIEYCRIWEGLVDIFTFAHDTSDPCNAGPTFFDRNNPPTLKYSVKFKEAGIKGVACPDGLFHSVDDIERFIAEGKCDMVSMARSMLADPDFYKKLMAGKPEDMVPCIYCDKCHGGICSANPKLGLSHVYPDLFEPSKPKKVAVIGGGPSGMQAAISASEAGHKVVLFEKTMVLGGQLNHADYLKNKWNLSDFRNYLVRAVEKAGVDVRYGTEATPELIESGGFDAVIAACGAKPKKGDVPGSESDNVWTPFDIFGNEDKLGKKVVVIGGSMMGVDSGTYLAEMGHEVILLTRRPAAGYDYKSHSARTYMNWLNSGENPRIIPNATTLKIEAGKVTYHDADGIEHVIECDGVVYSGGKEPLTEECYSFAGITPIFRVVGDSNRQETPPYSPTSDITKAIEQDFDVRHATFTGFMAGKSI